MATTGAQLLQGLRGILSSRKNKEITKASEAQAVLKMAHQQNMQDRTIMINQLNQDINLYTKQAVDYDEKINQAALENSTVDIALKNLSPENKSGKAEDINFKYTGDIINDLSVKRDAMFKKATDARQQYNTIMDLGNTYNKIVSLAKEEVGKYAGADENIDNITAQDLTAALETQFKNNDISVDSKLAQDITNMVVTDSVVKGLDKTYQDFQNSYGEDAILKKGIEDASSSLNIISQNVASNMVSAINPIISAQEALNADPNNSKLKAGVTESMIRTFGSLSPGLLENAGITDKDIQRYSSGKPIDETKSGILGLALASSDNFIAGYQEWQAGKDNDIPPHSAIIKMVDSFIKLSENSGIDKATLDTHIKNNFFFMGTEGFEDYRLAVKGLDEMVNQQIQMEFERLTPTPPVNNEIPDAIDNRGNDSDPASQIGGTLVSTDSGDTNDGPEDFSILDDLGKTVSDEGAFNTKNFKVNARKGLGMFDWKTRDEWRPDRAADDRFLAGAGADYRKGRIIDGKYVEFPKLDYGVIDEQMVYESSKITREQAAEDLENMLAQGGFTMPEVLNELQSLNYKDKTKFIKNYTKKMGHDPNSKDGIYDAWEALGDRAVGLTLNMRNRTDFNEELFTIDNEADFVATKKLLEAFGEMKGVNIVEPKEDAPANNTYNLADDSFLRDDASSELEAMTERFKGTGAWSTEVSPPVKNENITTESIMASHQDILRSLEEAPLRPEIGLGNLDETEFLDEDITIEDMPVNTYSDEDIEKQNLNRKMLEMQLAIARNKGKMDRKWNAFANFDPNQAAE